MTKAELVAKIASDAEISKATAEKALKATLDGIVDALKKADKVTLVGFGTFMVAKRKARKGRNPKTREEINIPAAKVAKFKPGKALREAVK